MTLIRDHLKSTLSWSVIGGLLKGGQKQTGGGSVILIQTLVNKS